MCKPLDRWRPAHLIVVLALMCTSRCLAATVIQDIQGTNLPVSRGFRIGSTIASSGRSVSAAGDVNNDGIADIIVGSPFETVQGTSNAGTAFVVFGRNLSFTENFDVALMVTGRDTGFRILGRTTDDRLGTAVSAAGDVNNDGVDDVMVGDLSSSSAGCTYIIFGRTVTPTSTNAFTDIVAADGGPGLTVICGASAGDYSGFSVSNLGDVNGDSYDDVVIGAKMATPGAHANAGIVYVVYGSPTLPSYVPLVTFTTSTVEGFRILGEAEGDQCGASVSGAGDVNDDGKADIIVSGSYLINFLDYNNVAYVVFGLSHSGARGDVDLASMVRSATTGFSLIGFRNHVVNSVVVSRAGDFNGDGVDDIILGECGYSIWDGSTTVPNYGMVYVVYGKSYLTTPTVADVQLFSIVPADVSKGFFLLGGSAGDELGWAVGAAGDINNDNVDDIIVGARSATMVKGVATNGVAYVLFGRAGFPCVDMQYMGADALYGFAILGTTSGLFQSGYSVSGVGDINDDGIDDVIAGAASYVVYGANFVDSPPPTALPSAVPTVRPTSPAVVNQDVWMASAPLDRGFRIKDSIDGTGFSVCGAGDFNGDGIDDIVIGNPYEVVINGSNVMNDAGMVTVVFGRAGQFPSVDLPDMFTGRYTGFRIYGANPNDQLGYSVSGAGDFNNDGVDDIAMGAVAASPDGRTYAGVTYVLFGRKVTSGADAFQDIHLASYTLSPTTMIAFYGVGGGDLSGWAVSGAGDVNGDTIDDLLVGAKGASPYGSRPDAGIVYVIFGTAGPASTALSTIMTGASHGYRIMGEATTDELGSFLSGAGDVNDDGLADIIIGGIFLTSPGNDNLAYVIFGQHVTGPRSDLDLLNMPRGLTTGYTIWGSRNNNPNDVTVSRAGDFNGDGIGDVMIGTYGVNISPHGTVLADAGIVFVLYGRKYEAAVPVADVNLLALTAAQGFAVTGASAGDWTGWALGAAGDINNDGLDDIIVGASAATSYHSLPVVGITYVIYGHVGGLSSIDLSTWQSSASTGFRILGASGMHSGYAVSAAGDINKDGVDDVIVGSATYVVYGGQFVAQPTALPTPPPTHVPKTIQDVWTGSAPSDRGFRVMGSGDSVGYSVRNAGDFNHDGIDDVLVGWPLNPAGVNIAPGITYVVFGRNAPRTSYLDLPSMITGMFTGFRISGAGAVDGTGNSVSSAGDFNGDGVSDIVIGCADPYGLGYAGTAYIIFGRAVTAEANAFQNIDLGSYPSGPTTMIRIDNAPALHYSGYIVSNAGDVNGDNIDDVLIGAPAAASSQGVTYVIFGTLSPVDVDLSSIIAGANTGFRVFGAAAQFRSGFAVNAAGDVNGDNIADFIIGSYLADASPQKLASGVSYVLFGLSAAGLPRNDVYLQSMTADRAVGFRIFGAASNDQSGAAVSGVGDVNGDGIDDIAVGSYLFSPVVIFTRTQAGAVHIIYGRKVLPTDSPMQDIDLSTLISDTRGFRILGARAADWCGFSVNPAGDVNHDGIQDIIIGARYATLYNGVAIKGASYVIFGKNGQRGEIDLLIMPTSVATGFRILGTTSGDQQSGLAVSTAGDINDDGIDDVIVGSAAFVVYGGNFVDAPTSQPSSQPTGQPSRQPSGQPSSQPSCRPSSQPTSQPTSQPSTQPSSQPSRQPSGQPSSQPSGQPTYRPTLTFTEITDVDLRAVPKTQGFHITGTTAYAMSSAGDVNGDGFGDVILGYPFATVEYAVKAGMAVVVFGRNTSSRTTDVHYYNMVTGRYTGFKIFSATAGDQVGASVSGAGDVNNDGVDDIIVGDQTGLSYVIFGHRVTTDADAFIDIPLASMATGPTTFIYLFCAEKITSVSDAGDVNGDGIDDVIVGVPGSDVSLQSSTFVGAGISYVVFGTAAPANLMLNAALTTLGLGFRITGWSADDMSGLAVSAAGDVNGDGAADILIAAPQAGDQISRSRSGAVFVVFGYHSRSPADVSLVAGQFEGFVIWGANSFDLLGVAISGAGDVNGDRVDDIIVGSSNAAVSLPGAPQREGAGTAYVILGRNSVITDVDLSAVTSSSLLGYRILGSAAEDGAGCAVSGAGDVNDDGFDDVIIGAQNASASATRSDSGVTYVLFGHTGQFDQVDLLTMRSGAATGLRVLGAQAGDTSGSVVSAAGDVNGDGVSDFMVGPGVVIYGANYVNQPTSQPSGQPSGQPSRQPSSQPTSQPSRQPSSQPSSQPSGQPTSQPTRQPTSQPSRQPSSVPSAQPSAQPSRQPSAVPSCVPSAQPSSTPSSQPTGQPTGVPSTQPSTQPSSQPSVLPSGQPSSVPTSQPSSQPSARPSGQPSALPSVSPSSQPSSVPSVQPSSQPSVQPTGTPTCQPSSLPSGQPSAQPSGMPSTQPSTDPSAQPSTQPSSLPSATPSGQPSSVPSSKPSGQPSSVPTVQPSADPSVVPSSQPSAQPSAVPSTQPSGQPSSGPTSQPSGIPSAQPTTEPSSRPSAQPSSRPSAQPSEQPQASPTAQPSAQPSRLPSAQPSGQPSAQPTSVPTISGEWATFVSTVMRLDLVRFVNSDVWACGGGASGDAVCALANYMTGEVFSHYRFGWDAVTSVVVPSAANRIFIGGRVTGAAATTSAVANCEVEPVMLICSVKSFLNTNFLGSSYSPLTGRILYVGKSSNFATATVVDSSGVNKELNYYYSAAGLSSIALLRAASPPSFVGTFVSGTGVSGASSHRILTGWIRMQSGDLTCMSLVPRNGVILNAANLVLAMELDFIGPDSFIGGALELSASTSAGAWGYILRANALYTTVQYCVRFVPFDTRRRLLSASFYPSSSVVRAMTRVELDLYIIVESLSTDQSQSVIVIRADAATGSIAKQATLSAVNASIMCTDITSAENLLDITCKVQRVGAPSQEAQLISVNRDLTFSHLPVGFVRDSAELFVTESVALAVTRLQTTKHTTTIETTDSTIVVTNQIPTYRPTVAPSAGPSEPPSSAPSSQPSSSPSSAPSMSPRPTSTPSTSGPTNTHKPSAAPTIRPTRSPTATITALPSKSPTMAPTTRPSSPSPSARPTLSPSTLPTRAPVIAPTARPTSAPTLRPTSSQTVAPSRDAGELKGNSSGTPSYVIAVSVMGSVLLVCLCAFLFYQRHELRVQDVQKKFAHVVPSAAAGARPTWLAHGTPDVLMLDASDSNSDIGSGSKSEYSESEETDQDQRPVYFGGGANVDGLLSQRSRSSSSVSPFHLTHSQDSSEASSSDSGASYSTDDNQDLSDSSSHSSSHSSSESKRNSLDSDCGASGAFSADTYDELMRARGESWFE